ncbi:MAG TPA: hypothetical protein VGM91_12290 [Conexibacter sp.]|jgi:PAS domain-containing protein
MNRASLSRRGIAARALHARQRAAASLVLRRLWGTCNAAGPPSPFGRACPSCERGLLVEALAELSPAPGDPFLLVDEALTVISLSPAAAELLGRDVPAGLPISELLTDAALETRGPSFAAVIAAAACGDAEPRTATVRLTGEFGIRHRVRVATCGPPRCALLAFDTGPRAEDGPCAACDGHRTSAPTIPRLRLCT